MTIMNESEKDTMNTEGDVAEHAKRLEAEKVEYYRACTGRCTFVCDRWFGEGTSRDEIERYMKAYDRRAEKNRRLREQRRERRRIERLIEAVETLPPWRQRALCGWTATRTKETGEWESVDYLRTYSPTESRILPGAVPFQMLFDFAHDAVGSIVARFFKASRTPSGRKKVRSSTQRDAESVETRLRVERRKVRLRSTVAAKPTAADIRVLWRFRRSSPDGYLRLGALLLDLECHVDNSLIVWWEKRGKESRPRIVGRRPGVRGWIAENCPELIPHYKTLMRYKALAEGLRQAVELPDPIPLSALLADEHAEEIVGREVHVQPRGGGTHDDRFPWELAKWQLDANGRMFKADRLYWCVRPVPLDGETVGRILSYSRAALKPILETLRGEDPRSSRIRGRMSVRLEKAVWRTFGERERWWGRPLSTEDRGRIVMEA